MWYPNTGERKEHLFKDVCCKKEERDTLMKRVFLIVLDSVGIGAMEDAADFGDAGTNTLRSAAGSACFHMPNMEQLGLFNIDGVDWKKGVKEPQAVYGRMKEASKGKDTTIGHWEIAGVISKKPLPVYPDGFPKEITEAFCSMTGRSILCNRPYSGTEVIKDYGDEHVKTGDLIVYTSADSVFQVAAHEDVVPVETLYEYCKMARELLKGEHSVGRVIARPFRGESGNYVRTSGRHDYSLEPPAETMLDAIKRAGKEVIGVGKIRDIFAGRGITSYVYTNGNADGIAKTIEYLGQDFEGLCFINLVDYDMLYGHRNDIEGYARALSEFDDALPQITGKLRDDDLLMITADHGCDPGYTVSTDHSREYTPLIIYGKKIVPGNLGTRNTFADIGATVLKVLGVEGSIAGKAVL